MALCMFPTTGRASASALLGVRVGQTRSGALGALGDLAGPVGLGVRALTWHARTEDEDRERFSRNEKVGHRWRCGARFGFHLFVERQFYSVGDRPNSRCLNVGAATERGGGGRAWPHGRKACLDVDRHSMRNGCNRSRMPNQSRHRRRIRSLEADFSAGCPRCVVPWIAIADRGQRNGPCWSCRASTAESGFERARTLEGSCVVGQEQEHPVRARYCIPSGTPREVRLRRGARRRRLAMHGVSLRSSRLTARPPVSGLFVMKRG